MLLILSLVNLAGCDVRSDSTQSEARENPDTLAKSEGMDSTQRYGVISNDSSTEKISPNIVESKESYERFLFESRLPFEIRDVLNKLDNKYAFYFGLNPFYLRGDFNGDGFFDIAILITELSSGKRGILIYHGEVDKIYILGAGNPLEREQDSPENVIEEFSWLNVWFVFGKKDVDQGVTEDHTITLIGEAIHAEKAEAAAGLIYWNGKGYLFYQQGD